MAVTNGLDDHQDSAQNGSHVVESKERSAKEIEVLKLMRARSMDVKKASKMFAQHQKWRREYFPLGHAQEDEIKDEIAANKFFIQGHDRTGRPLSFWYGARHFGGGNLEQYKRGITYCLDKLISSLPPGQEKFVIIADLKGVGYKNLDVRGWLGAYDFVQAYYPERLGRVYILHPPMIFWASWKLVFPFLDPVIKKKIVFVDNAKIEETLLADIAKEELPTACGGLKEMVPFELAHPPNWPQFKAAAVAT